MKTKYLLILISFLMLNQSCVTQTEKEIQNKESQESRTLKRSDLIAEGNLLIEKSPSLNETQKVKLRSLWKETEEKIDVLAKTSLELRALLIQDVISSNYSETEVDVVKTKIASVEKDRLRVFLHGVFETNHILGRWGSANERNSFYQWFTISPGLTTYLIRFFRSYF